MKVSGLSTFVASRRRPHPDLPLTDSSTSPATLCLLIETELLLLTLKVPHLQTMRSFHAEASVLNAVELQ